MASYLITVDTNIDVLTGKTGGDTYDLSDANLTIDQDSRYGLNQTTSASLGRITTVSGKQGDVIIDGRKIRLIPFTSGSGSLPTLGSVISQTSGASGKLIAVWSALDVAPVTSGTMPASGWIKIKQWNDVPFAAGALTGITATATGVDVAGWLEIVGDANAQIVQTYGDTLYMLGEWYYVGVTTGSTASTYQIPTSGSNLQIGGVWVETAVDSGEYERYPNIIGTAGVTTVATDTVRGKWCYIDIAGVLRLGSSDGSNTSCHCPSAGRKIRIGNIFLQTCTTAARTANIGFTGASSQTTYYRIDGNKTVIADKVSLGIQLHNTYSVMSYNFTNVSVIQYFRMNILAASTFTDCMLGCTAVDTQTSILFATPLTMNGFSAAIYDSGTSWWIPAVLEKQVNGVTMSDIHIATIRQRHVADKALLNLNTSSNISIDDITLGGGAISINTTSGTNLLKNIKYYDNVQGIDTASAYSSDAVIVGNTTQNLTIDGISFPAGLNSHCYGALVHFSGTFCSNVRYRNVGTPATPVNLGSANICGGPWRQSYNIYTNRDVFIDRIYTTAGRNTGLSTDYAFVGVTYKSVSCGYPSIRSNGTANTTTLSVTATNYYLGPARAVGTHFIALFTSATTGYVALMPNPTTEGTESYFTYEGAVHSGDTFYNLTAGEYGYVQMSCPHWFRGFTGFTSYTVEVWPFTLATVEVTYRIDTGSGFSSWKDISLITSETIDSTVGFRIETKTQSITAGKTIAGRISFVMTTTASDQLLALYPMDVSTLQINWMVPGSTVKVTKTSNGDVLSIGTASLVDIEYAGEVRVVIRKGTGSPTYKQWDTIVTLVSGETTVITALQELDE